MDNKPTVIAKNISKSYKIYANQKYKVRDLIYKKEHASSFYALKDVSFTAEEGDCIGLLGLNGSGKSTLANIIAGISRPTSGSLDITGEASLISISSGLNPQLTGVENIELKGLMLGFTMDEINQLKGQIADFADLGAFIDQPIKSYSSGMKARLGFAISVNIDPDILVIDEALSVGDPSFTSKCLDKMNDFRKANKTIFFVSHSLSQIQSFCNKALWLEYGMSKVYSATDDVLPAYDGFLKAYVSMSAKQKQDYVDNIIKNHSHLLIQKSSLK